MNYAKSEWMVEKFHQIVPGGSHTYSKGDDQFPTVSPKFIERAKGAYCWDVDGNQFLDWAMGNRVMILGHADSVVNQAVFDAINKGVNFTRPGILEYELAEYLLDLWPFAEMVKFGKNGSDVTTAAVKLARAYTEKSYVVVCEDHPFFAIHDWFIGSTPMHSGVIEEHRQHTLKFKYNDIESFERLLMEYPNQIAAVILEPIKNDKPENDFLAKLRSLTKQHGVVLIFDEMIAGMRFGEKGAHDLYGVYPDLACFGKAISNGFSFSVLAGQRDIMMLGGIQHDKKRVFLLSQTHSSEVVGLAACRATLDEYLKRNVKKHILHIGKKLKDGFNNIVKESGIEKHLHILGFSQNPQIICTDSHGKYWPELHTLFHQLMIEKGILIPWISITDSHTDLELNLTLEAIASVADELILHAESPDAVRRKLVGPSVKPVFRAFN